MMPLFFSKCLFCLLVHRVPEIVHVNRIIKICFDIIEGEVKIIKSSKSLNAQMFGFRDFPTLKLIPVVNLP